MTESQPMTLGDANRIAKRNMFRFANYPGVTMVGVGERDNTTYFLVSVHHESQASSIPTDQTVEGLPVRVEVVPDAAAAANQS